MISQLERTNRFDEKKMNKQDMSAVPTTDNTDDHVIPEVSPTTNQEQKRLEEISDEDLFDYFLGNVAHEDEDEAFDKFYLEKSRRAEEKGK